jgi:hypothetical protein
MNPWGRLTIAQMEFPHVKEVVKGSVSEDHQSYNLDLDATHHHFS